MLMFHVFDPTSDDGLLADRMTALVIEEGFVTAHIGSYAFVGDACRNFDICIDVRYHIAR